MPTLATATREKHQRARKYLKKNQQAKAKSIYEKLCAQDPQDYEAWLQLGRLQLHMQQAQAAEQSLRQATGLNNQSADGFYWLGKSLVAQQRFEEASQLLAHCVNLDETHAQAYMELGQCLLHMQQAETALACYERAVQLQADLYAQLLEAGKVLLAAHNYRQATRFLGKAVEMQPGNAIALGYLAQAVMFLGDNSLARQLYQQAIKAEPNNIGLYINLGHLLNASYEYAEAIAVLDKALDLQADNVDALHNLATAYFSTGLYEKAEALFRHALDIDPGYALSQKGLVGTLIKTGRFDQALVSCDALLNRKPDDIAILSYKADALRRSKRQEEAYTLLRTAFNKGIRDAELIKTLVSVSADAGLEDDVLMAAEELLNNDNLTSNKQKVQLHFTLGKVLDKYADYDRAFMHYRQGNTLKGINYDHEAFVSEINRLVGFFCKDYFARQSTATPGEQRPIFIVGMPRSATSLVEQILASHPRVHGAGELYTLNSLTGSLCESINSTASYPDCLGYISRQQLDQLANLYMIELARLNPEKADHVTDKMPHNFLRLGLIALLFPDAHIIHTRRNAIDTCLSCYFQDFVGSHNYSYNLEDLARYYLEYERLMEHWRNVLPLHFIDVDYESLVSNPENVVRDMLDYCGLDWDPQCLKFHENKRAVVTASQDQVSEPLYSTSVGRWRHYARHLEGLRQILNR